MIKENISYKDWDKKFSKSKDLCGLVLFSDSSIGEARQIIGFFRKNESELRDRSVCSINMDKHRQILTLFEPHKLPSTILIIDGEVKDCVEGFDETKLENLLRTILTRGTSSSKAPAKVKKK